jgi:hypothetical protein
MTRRDLWVALAAAAVASLVSSTVCAQQRWEPFGAAAAPPKYEIVCEAVGGYGLSGQLWELTNLGQEAGAKGYQLVQVLINHSGSAEGICFQRPR